MHIFTITFLGFFIRACELNWHKTDQHQKSMHIYIKFIWYRAPYKEQKPKEMSGLYDFVVDWRERGKFGRVVKQCEEAEGR